MPEFFNKFVLYKSDFRVRMDRLCSKHEFNETDNLCPILNIKLKFTNVQEGERILLVNR